LERLESERLREKECADRLEARYGAEDTVDFRIDSSLRTEDADANDLANSCEPRYFSLTCCFVLSRVQEGMRRTRTGRRHPVNESSDESDMNEWENDDAAMAACQRLKGFRVLIRFAVLQFLREKTTVTRTYSFMLCRRHPSV